MQIQKNGKYLGVSLIWVTSHYWISIFCLHFNFNGNEIWLFNHSFCGFWIINQDWRWDSLAWKRNIGSEWEEVNARERTVVSE